MKAEPGELLAEEPLRGYLALKVTSFTIASLLAVVDGFFLYSYLQRQAELAVVAGVILITLPVWVGLLAIGPLLRRQRSRLYASAFAPPHKPVSHLFRSGQYLVPLEYVDKAEHRHEKTHFLVTTAEGKVFIFWVGSVGSDFYQKLSGYFDRQLSS